MPSISNTHGSGAVITARNSNDISGLIINDTTGRNAIFINGKVGYYNIYNNAIYLINGNGSNGGIVFIDSALDAFIINNTLIGTDNSRTGGIIVNNCSGNFMISNNSLMGLDENSGLYLGIGVNYNSSYLFCSIIDNILNFSLKASNTAIGVRVGYISSAMDTNILIADNTINNISRGILRQLNAGIGVQVGGSISTTVRNNKVNTLNPIEMPAYNFQTTGEASLSQINFAPDNIGNITSSDF